MSSKKIEVEVEYRKSDKKYFYPNANFDERALAREGYLEVDTGGTRRCFNRPVSIILYFRIGLKGIVSVEVKDEVLKLYGKKVVSEKIFERFKEDLYNGDVVFAMNDGFLKLVKVEDVVRNSSGVQMEIRAD